RPGQPALVVVLLGDGGHRPRQADAVRAHRHPYRLAVRAERVEAEHVGEPATEVEDVADLDTVPRRQRAGAPRAWITGAYVSGLDRPVRREVPPAHHVDRVPVGFVGAGQPRGARHHPRIDEVADAELREDLRTDVPADEIGVPGEVVEQLNRGRVNG